MIGLTELLLFVISLAVAVYVWSKYNYSYWRRKNVAYIEPFPVLGNLKEIITMGSCAGDHLRNLYNYKDSQEEPVLGIYIFNKPGLLIRDPEVIKSILVKDFNKFSNRYATIDPHMDALGSANLFFAKNPQWRELRTKLTPVFSSGKLKQMFPLIEEIGRELDKYLCDLEVDSEKSCIQELKEISSCFTTDVIATVAFGIKANSLKNPNADFRRNGRNIVKFTVKRAIEVSIIFFLPHLVKFIRCKVFSKESSEFLRSTINFVMAERIKSGTIRNDLIDILIAFKKAAELDTEKNNLPMNNDVLVAQAAFFFTAGFETSSSAMAFSMYELSKAPESQKQLREEIKKALTKTNGKVTYDVINEMEYLNMVVQEVLRMYPPLPFLDRVCTLPMDETEYSLKPFSDFAIPDGMPCYIPVYGIQRDPKHFPNPGQFDPDRFSPENKGNVKPFTYMPFGTGPHNCIGERLGVLQSKIGLISILRNHYIMPCEKSHKEMVLDPKAMAIRSLGGMFCKIVRDPLIKV